MPIPGAPAGLRIATPRFHLPAEDACELLPDDEADFDPDEELCHVDAPAPDTFDDEAWPDAFDSS